MRLLSWTKLHTCGTPHTPVSKLCATFKKDSNRHHFAAVMVGIQKQEEMTGVSKDMEKSPSSLQSHRTGIWKYRRASYPGKTSLRKLA
jgi:hypothetical protein